MNPSTALTEALRALHAEKLDASSRGSGFNAVWRVRVGGEDAILKTYASRRSPLQTALSVISHWAGGRTPYTARGRCRTERECLALWKRLGFDVPEILPDPAGPAIPLPHLWMERLDGVRLSALLNDPAVPAAQKDEVFIRFLAEWGRRHAAAERLREPRLIQEHATIEHVMVCGPRLVTFDLEVAYRSRAVQPLIAAEICGYVRSLFARLDPECAAHCLELIVRRYPKRQNLESACRDMLRNPNPLRRWLNRLDRRFLRKPGAMHKYRAAELLQSALGR